jgi:NAD(P)-dependent dehydrogenase (short-subunit alcohol dehydrogenase family)
MGSVDAWSDRPAPESVTLVEVDLRRFDAYDAAFARAHEVLGPIDVLVNAAGNFEATDVEHFDPESYRRTIDLVLKSPFFATKAAVRYMKDRHGVVLNLGSVRSSLAAPGQLAYSAAAAGMASMTRDLATDLGRYGIKCNTITSFVEGAPSLTRDELGTVDILETVGFLASERAYWAIDAFEYPIDGGLGVMLSEVDRAGTPVVDAGTAPVAVVTGGSGGLGAAIAEQLAQEGTRVAILDVLDDAGEALASRLAEHIQVEYFRCDISDAGRVRQVVGEIDEHFGRIDMLFNSAAVTSRTRTPEISEDLWDSFMEIDILGQFVVARECAKVMRRTRSGRIVNFSSMLSTLSHGRHTLYGGAKEAVNAMTRSLAAALAPDGIQVVSMLPAYVMTPMTEFRLDDAEWLARNYRQSLSKVLLYPEHVTGVFTHLATSRTEASTGHKIHVDSGYLGFRHKLVDWAQEPVGEGASNNV